MTVLSSRYPIHDPAFVGSVTYHATLFEFLARASQAAERLSDRTGQGWILRALGNDGQLTLRCHDRRVAAQWGLDPCLDIVLELRYDLRTVTISVTTALPVVADSFTEYTGQLATLLPGVRS